MPKQFNEIKGNCDYRVPARHPGMDHCDYHNDDCQESCCPKMDNPHYNEVPLSQCPMCGHETVPEEIDWSMQRTKYPFTSGMVLGAIGVIGFLSGLYALMRICDIGIKITLIP